MTFAARRHPAWRGSTWELNHAAGAAEGITAIYNRHAYAEEQRHALNTWGAHVERIVAGKDAGNVVELHGDAG